MFADDELRVKQRFLNVTAGYFTKPPKSPNYADADPMFQFDFSHNPDGVGYVINDIIADKTNYKITELLPQGKMLIQKNLFELYQRIPLPNG